MALAYFSNYGLGDGPLLHRSHPPALEVFTAPHNGVPIGLAYRDGHVQYGGVVAAAFRLVISAAELPGKRVCVGRRFVEL